jgi:hypothetical protein
LLSGMRAKAASEAVIFVHNCVSSVHQPSYVLYNTIFQPALQAKGAN